MVSGHEDTLATIQLFDNHMVSSHEDTIVKGLLDGSAL